MPVLLLVVFINFVGIGALIPVLPYTVIETLGLSATVMTLLLASFAFAMFLSNPLLGRLSDYIGRRPVLIVSLGVNVLAHIWFAFSSDIVQMFAARILAGLAGRQHGRDPGDDCRPCRGQGHGRAIWGFLGRRLEPDS